MTDNTTTPEPDQTTPRYPHIEVALDLNGPGGNAFAVLGAVRQALKDDGVDREDIAEFINEATAGDYDALKATVRRWVSVT